MAAQDQFLGVMLKYRCRILFNARSRYENHVRRRWANGSQTPHVFKIHKNHISIRLTAPYSDDRQKAASELSKKRGIHSQYK